MTTCPHCGKNCYKALPANVPGEVIDKARAKAEGKPLPYVWATCKDGKAADKIRYGMHHGNLRTTAANNTPKEDTNGK